MPTGWHQLRDSIEAWLENKQGSGLDPDLCCIVMALANACSMLAEKLRTSPLEGLTGATENINVQGEVQKPLDVIANEIFLDSCGPIRAISYAVSEELDEEVTISNVGNYAVIFDPLDGSSNLDVNVTVGSIFSVLPAKSVADLLRPGRHQVFAGFASYGPSTSLFVTFGETVDMFTLKDGVWELARPEIEVPPRYSEFAINYSRRRYWQTGIRGYVDDCIAGEEGSSGVRYNSRWVGSMVAEIQRILTRGGVFLYPNDTDIGSAGGRCRFAFNSEIFRVACRQTPLFAHKYETTISFAR